MRYDFLISVGDLNKFLKKSEKANVDLSHKINEKGEVIGSVISSLNKNEIEDLFDLKVLDFEVYSTEIHCEPDAIDDDTHIYYGNAKKHIFLEGIACLGKTTVLKRMEAEGFRVYYNEFGDVVNKYKMNMKDPMVVATMQDFFQYGKWNDMQKRPGIHDRSHVSAYIYRLIFMRMQGLNYAALYNIILPKIRKFAKDNYLVYVYIDMKNNTKENLLKTMIARSNGIDDMDLKYIEAQNSVFDQVRRDCPELITFKRDVVDGKINFNDGLFEYLACLYTGEPVMYPSKYLQIGHIPLVSKSTDGLNCVTFSKVFIPPNMVGLVNPIKTVKEKGCRYCYIGTNNANDSYYTLKLNVDNFLSDDDCYGKLELVDSSLFGLDCMIYKIGEKL